MRAEKMDTAAGQHECLAADLDRRDGSQVGVMVTGGGFLVWGGLNRPKHTARPAQERIRPRKEDAQWANEQTT